MRRIPRRTVVRAVTVAFLSVGVVVAGGVQPAQAVVVPSPGLPPGSTADPSAVALDFVPVATGLTQPVLVQTANDGLSRLYVVERRGTIKVWTPTGGVQPGLYLDIRSRVDSESGGERGLLGLAFSPNFATDHRFWVSYTDSSGALIVSRFTAAAASSTAVSPTTEVRVLRVPHSVYANHNAGMLVFGREGKLYISTGDGGGGGDPFAHAQDLGSLSGKILRIDPFNGCGGKHYCVPPSNPYAAPGGGLGEIWVHGLRNAWRFSVDKSNGDLWIADVGQDKYEEVTRVPYAQMRWNLGWSCREGRSTYNSSRCSSSTTYRDPTIVYGHASGEAIIGGYVYRGTRFTSLLHGLYVYGDFTSGHVWVFGGGVSSLAADVGTNRLSAFGQGDTGELYATTLDGALYRVDATAA